LISYPLVVESIKSEITPELVGNKAYNLMVMSTLGLPVPKGFVIPTDVESIDYDEIVEEFELHDIGFPVSVRSGAAVSMPGMMDTILNVGINDIETSEEAFKQNCFYRLIETMAASVYHIDDSQFKEINQAAQDFYIDDAVKMNTKIAERYLDILSENNIEFPYDPYEQLFHAASSVKDSWNSKRAIQYRESEGISHDGGTAVIVQEMVFGNRNSKSGTGVVFSHNPNTGKPGLYGDFMSFAQGEDIVSGTKIPMSIDSMINDDKFKRAGKQLKAYIGKLLRHFKFIQDVEFTIDDGELFILQTRNGKCSPKASIRSALSMVNNGSMSIQEATDMVIESIPQDKTSNIQVDESMLVRLGFGIGVSDGEMYGAVACSAEFAEKLQQDKIPYIFCAEITSPEDTETMRHSVGVLTSMGGRLSHAAVLARYMSKPTVVGFEAMSVDHKGFTVEEDRIENGDMIKIDGTTGSVFYIS